MGGCGWRTARGLSRHSRVQRIEGNFPSLSSTSNLGPIEDDIVLWWYEVYYCASARHEFAVGQELRAEAYIRFRAGGPGEGRVP